MLFIVDVCCSAITGSASAAVFTAGLHALTLAANASGKTINMDRQMLQEVLDAAQNQGIVAGSQAAEDLRQLEVPIDA